MDIQLLKEAAIDFINKVDTGRARSKDSYSKFKEALGENYQSKTGVELIAEERTRQIEKEGWTFEHDDQHEKGELSDAAVFYALTDETIEFINDEWGNDMHLHFWPFELSWMKRSKDNRIKDLQKAGALIAAEIDRLNRL